MSRRGKALAGASILAVLLVAFLTGCAQGPNPWALGSGFRQSGWRLWEGCGPGGMMGGRGYSYEPYGPSQGLTSTPTPAGTPAPVAAGDAARGKQIFLRNCAACHGADASGSQLGPSLISAEVAANDDDFLRDAIANGRPGTSMPSYGGVLSPQDIEDVIAFLRSKQ